MNVCMFNDNQMVLVLYTVNSHNLLHELFLQFLTMTLSKREA